MPQRVSPLSHSQRRYVALHYLTGIARMCAEPGWQPGGQMSAAMATSFTALGPGRYPLPLHARMRGAQGLVRH